MQTPRETTQQVPFSPLWGSEGEFLFAVNEGLPIREVLELAQQRLDAVNHLLKNRSNQGNVPQEMLYVVGLMIDEAIALLAACRE